MRSQGRGEDDENWAHDSHVANVIKFSRISNSHSRWSLTLSFFLFSCVCENWELQCVSESRIRKKSVEINWNLNFQLRFSSGAQLTQNVIKAIKSSHWAKLLTTIALHQLFLSPLLSLPLVPTYTIFHFPPHTTQLYHRVLKILEI